MTEVFALANAATVTVDQMLANPGWWEDLPWYIGSSPSSAWLGGPGFP